MKIYQVIHNNVESYEDSYEYTGGTYTTREEAEREILQGGYMTRDGWSKPYRYCRYVVDEVVWAKKMNEDREMDSGCTGDDIKPEECTDYSWSEIKEFKLLEIFSPREDVTE